MTVTEVANQTYTGLSTDTKPTVVTAGARFIETDTGTIFTWNGVYWVNNHYTNPILRRTGALAPTGIGSSTNAFVLDGILAKGSGTGASAIASAYDTTEGTVVSFATTATSGLNAGYVGSHAGIPGIGTRRFGARMVMRAKVDAGASNVAPTRLYMGVSDFTSLPISDIPIANGNDGAYIGFRSSDTNYQAFTNNAGGAMLVTPLTGPVAIDSNYHTFEINWTASGNINFILDGVITTVSSQLPGVDAASFFDAAAQTTTTIAHTLTVKGIWISSSK